jgi:hypothetical protein
MTPFMKEKFKAFIVPFPENCLINMTVARARDVIRGIFVAHAMCLNMAFSLV